MAGDSAAGLCGGLLASGGQVGAVLGSTRPGVATSVGVLLGGGGTVVAGGLRETVQARELEKLVQG